MVGRTFKQLWEISKGPFPEEFFNGTITEREGENNMVKYEDCPHPIPVAAADFKMFAKRKTLTLTTSNCRKTTSLPFRTTPPRTTIIDTFST